MTLQRSTETQVYNKIKSILIEMGFNQYAIKPTANFTHDLGFDSLDYADFILQVEMAFDITLPYDKIEKECKTVGDLSQLVAEISP